MLKEWIRGKSVAIVCNLNGVDKYLIYDLIKRYNCNIICICSNEERIQCYKEKLIEFKDKLNFQSIDVMKEDDWLELTGRLKKLDISIDVLININEVEEYCLFDNLKHSNYEQCIANNFYKVIISIRHIRSIMSKTRNTAIVTLLDIKCLANSHGYSHYNSSAVAVKSFIETISSELKDMYFGIMYVDYSAKCTHNFDKYSSKFYVNTSKSIIKAINCKKKSCYIGNRAKLFKYLNKVSYNLSRKLIK